MHGIPTRLSKRSTTHRNIIGEALNNIVVTKGMRGIIIPVKLLAWGLCVVGVGVFPEIL